MKAIYTSLSFNNSTMINMLHERGTAIKSEKWDKMNEMNDKIT